MSYGDEIREENASKISLLTIIWQLLKYIYKRIKR